MTYLIIGVIAEGPTDTRFLIPVIEKVFFKVAHDCAGVFDFEIIVVPCDKGDSFVDFVINASQKGHQDLGITMLVVHTDADDASSDKVINDKITPAIENLQGQANETHCKNLIPLIPVYETESWMLADKKAFLLSIGTTKSENELGIQGNPETFSNPKKRIEEAIRIGRSELPKKIRNNLDISDLYSFLGALIQIDNLNNYKSYRDFEQNVRKAFVALNLLQDQN